MPCGSVDHICENGVKSIKQNGTNVSILSLLSNENSSLSPMLPTRIHLLLV